MKTSSYRRLTESEREQISRGLVRSHSYRVITQQLHRSVSTISREVTRNGGRHDYCSECAQRHGTNQGATRRFRKRKLVLNSYLQAYVHAKLRLQWSPEQIAVTLKARYPHDTTMQISHEAIYQYLYIFTKGTLKKKFIKNLRRQQAYRRKQGRKSRNNTVGRIVDLVSIEERPTEVLDRVVPGHWEGDIILGKYHRSALGTLVERTTRFAILVPLTAYDATTVRRAFTRAFKQLPAHLTRSLTYDQGKEMAEHVQFSIATGVQVYFAHPQSPWERGTNENTNGLVRQYFPKGTDFTKVSRYMIKRAQNRLNSRPRKTLDWKTPGERLEEVLR